ncbi:rhodanese-like domain-containing protein [Aquimarina sp. ERC-38]|uniref:rhodanese-like domain-containing protein n=1 Tax=Aquimarina sp. ERC-38 TaxID=2949996 RepID=UPI0022476A30|nr:rhodanese-like domain-containing protein [Aquimarina sp. ERC-38]UZO80803.1 rhodanese-like domain-containing protein [Aquimarina sp. ERC-38]
MRKVGLLLLVIQIAFTSFGQAKLTNPRFEQMLDSLLTHQVQEVLPGDIAMEQDCIYLDTREKKEYKVSRIKGATWVGYNSFALKKVRDIPKDQKIIVYCTVGYRSEKIAEKLVNAGFTNVSNLYGGIFEWVHQDQPVYNDTGSTQEVHTYDKNWSQWLHKGIKKF